MPLSSSPIRIRYLSARRRTCELLAQARPKDSTSRVVDLLIMALILLTVVIITLESLEPLRSRYAREFNAAELFFVVVFSVEYLLRLWSAADDPQFKPGGHMARLRYMLTPMALIDLAAVLPFYLIVFGTITGSDYLMMLKSVRLLRVLKLTRYSTSFTILTGVLRDNLRALTAALFLLMIVMMIAASGIYIFEREAQPTAFGSIPAAMWWAFATLTTVGYGDVTPITVGGKMFGASITVIGVGMVALPTAILASAFSEQLRLRARQYTRKVDKAMEDGVLTHDEKSELEVLRNALGISEESAERILATEYSRLTSAHVRASEPCPHCASQGSSPQKPRPAGEVLPIRK